jgi:hypothetical protein
MYLENTIYYNIYDNDYVSRYRSDDVMYSRMREVSNRLEGIDNGGGGEGSQLYYDVVYKEERPYISKNILKNNYTRYDELLMDHNTMYDMKSNNRNMNMKGVIGRIKYLMCCM